MLAIVHQESVFVGDLTDFLEWLLFILESENDVKRTVKKIKEIDGNRKDRETKG